MAKKTSEGFTQDRLDCLEAAIAEGALKVKYSDKEIEYRSLNEMLKIRDIMKKELSNCTKKKKGLFGGTRLEIQTDKDLC